MFECVGYYMIVSVGRVSRVCYYGGSQHAVIGIQGLVDLLVS